MQSIKSESEMTFCDQKWNRSQSVDHRPEDGDKENNGITVIRGDDEMLSHQLKDYLISINIENHAELFKPDEDAK